MRRTHHSISLCRSTKKGDIWPTLHGECREQSITSRLFSSKFIPITWTLITVFTMAKSEWFV
jgi:hypothetical protein